MTAPPLEVIKVVILPDGRMDTENAAKYIGCSEKTLANKRVDGTGPEFVNLGKIFYFKEKLDQWIATKRANSTSQKNRAIFRLLPNDTRVDDFIKQGR